MDVKSLWKIPENTTTERTPYVILSELAPFLAKITNELIRAHAIRHVTSGVYVSTDLIVVAPALGSYRVTLLNVRHELVSPFPARVRSSVSSTSVEVFSECELVSTIQMILESHEIQQILGSLIRESNVQPGEDELGF